MSSPLFFFIFLLFIILPELTATAIVLFSLVSMEEVLDMKIPSETENKLLHTTAPGLKSSVHEKGVVGYFPRYSRANTILEDKVEVEHYAPCHKYTNSAIFYCLLVHKKPIAIFL